MQVSNTADNVVSSIVTPHEAEAFTFANTPEAFSVFFASLYKDPLYALIREGICNAWDAHIASDNTHIPLEIILEDGHLTIKDSGTGIPHRSIQKTYCTIGNSTKKEDGQQTGGFGYGCKSPFAYTDNFEVTSHHNGEMVIYSMLRSDPNKEGFPSCNPIVTLPTTHTGLTLKIPMPQNTFSEIQRIIREVVYLGDIKATLNTEELPTFQMSFEDGAYCLFVPDIPSMIRGDNRLWVRYGNVVYPIHTHEAYDSDYNLATQFLKQLDSGHIEVHVIMQASPHTLAVTPSREELSMQDLTKNTLCDLLDVFLEKIPVEVTKEMDTIIETLTQFTGEAYSHFVSINKKVSLTPALDKELDELITQGTLSNRRIALTAVYGNSYIYKKRFEEIKKLRVQYVLDNASPQTAPLYREWVKGVFKLKNAYERNVDMRIPPKVMYKYYWRKAIQAWMSEPELYKKPLWVWQEYGDIRTPSLSSPPLHNITKSVPTHQQKYVSPFGATHNIVIIAFSKKSAYEHTPSKAFNKNLSGALVYVLPSKKIATHKLAVDTFTKAGYTIYDCTEHEDVAKVKGKYVPVATSHHKVPQGGNPVFNKKGEVLSISNIIGASGGVDIQGYRRRPSPRYIAKPEAIVHIPLNADTSNCRLPNCISTAKYVANALGDCIGVVTTRPQLLKVQGTISIDKLIQDRCIKHIRTSPYFMRKLQLTADKNALNALVSRGTMLRHLLDIYQSEYLRSLFKVKTPEKVQRPDDAMSILTSEFIETSTGRAVMRNLAANIKPHPSVIRMAKSVINSVLPNIKGLHIDFEDLGEVSDPHEEAFVASFVRLIMKKKPKE